MIKNIESIAEIFRSKKARKIAVLVGAGISVNAGIPDFRSRSGVYSGLESPEKIFNIHHFRKNPQDFYNFAPKLRRPNTVPTLTHYFLGFLEHLELLSIVYSQNVDGLERKAGVTKLVQAHGNSQKAHCSLCYKEYSKSDLVIAMRSSQVLYCDCKGPIKPDVVFFGESLPSEFEENLEKIKTSDFMFIIGTSLSVRPFSSLVGKQGVVPRVVINKTHSEAFSKLGFDFTNKGPDNPDFLFTGDCDQILQDLIRQIGWEASFSSFIKSNN